MEGWPYYLLSTKHRDRANFFLLSKFGAKAPLFRGISCKSQTNNNFSNAVRVCDGFITISRRSNRAGNLHAALAT